MNFIWADKIAVFLAVLVVLFCFAMGAGGVFAKLGDGCTAWVELTMIFVFPTWVLLRLIDALVGGPLRRVARRYDNGRYDAW